VTREQHCLKAFEGIQNPSDFNVLELIFEVDRLTAEVTSLNTELLKAKTELNHLKMNSRSTPSMWEQQRAEQEYYNSNI
jgi:hypothetical protein